MKDGSIQQRVLFLFWDKLSFYGERPYLGMSRWVFGFMTIGALVSLPFRLLILAAIPIFLYKCYGGKPRITGMLATIGILLYVCTFQFAQYSQTLYQMVILFLLFTHGGLLFNKKILPSLVKRLTQDEDAEQSTPE